MKKIDRLLITFVEQHLSSIAFVFLTLLSIVIRLKFIHFVDFNDGITDYNTALVPWINLYKEFGFVNGLAQEIGDYYVPYNLFLAVISLFNIEPCYPIVILSSIFDYLIVFAVYKLSVLLLSSGSVHSPLFSVVKNSDIKCFAVVFSLLPMIIINSSIFKQCDSIYTAFLLWSLYFFLCKKYSLSFIFIGLAFSFKLQTLFLLPFFIIAYFRTKEFSITHFFWIPIIFFLAGLPAILCGRPILETYTVYLNQTSAYHSMFMNFPSIYAIGMTEQKVFFSLAFIILMTLFVLAFIYIIRSKKEISALTWLYLAAWCFHTCVEFLPNMHERYDYFPIILLTFIMLIWRKQIIIPVCILHLISACTYGKCLNEFQVNYPLLSGFYFAAYLWLSLDLFGLLKSETPSVSS